MDKARLFVWLSIALFTLTCGLSALHANEDEKDIKKAGASVSILANNAENIYAAGARVDIEGTAKQDVYAAGAVIDVNVQTGGSLHVAGSRVNVNGEIAGNVRIAGAEVKIDADIGQALNAAAASITVANGAQLPEESTLAAALIQFGGSAEDNLTLYADEIIFTGQTTGSVTIEGRKVRIDEQARIAGDLTVRSAAEAVISQNAVITGEITQAGLEDAKYFKGPEDDAGSGGFLLVLATSVLLLGLLLTLFTREFVEQGIARLRAQPGRSIIWGWLIIITVPVLAIVAMVTVIGLPFGLTTLLLLPFLLILGLTMAIVGFSDWVLNKRAEPKNVGQRLVLILAGAASLVIIGFVPFLGGLVIFLVMLIGLGSAVATLGSLLNRRTQEVA